MEAHDRAMGFNFDSAWVKALTPVSETCIRETFEYVNPQLTYQQYREILSEASENRTPTTITARKIQQYATYT